MLWSIYSRVYDALLNLPAYNNTQEDIKNQIPEGSKVLVLGCGTGNLERILTSSTTVGVDNDAAMLKIATKKNQTGKDLYYKFSLEIEKYPFEDNTFDVVVLSNVLYAFKDVNHILEESKRVLKNLTGRFIIADPDPEFKKLEKGVVQNNILGLLKMLPSLPVIVLVNKIIDWKAVHGIYQYRSRKVWGEILKQFGFKSEFSSTYAGTSHLIVATREE